MTAGSVVVLIVFLQISGYSGGSAVQLFNDRPACEAALRDLRGQLYQWNKVVGGCYSLDAPREGK